MKKLTAFLLTVSILFTLAASAAESMKEELPKTLDVSYFVQNSQYFRTEETEDKTAVSIQTAAGAENRAFSTPYESDLYYSTVFPEILVANGQDESNGSCFFRIWFRYRGTKHLNIRAVSISLDGITYTFREVSPEDWTATKEDGTAAQDVVLILGRDPDNAACFASLFAKAAEYAAKRTADENTPKPEAKVILRGDEDVETDLPEGFWSETAIFVFSLDAVQGFPFLATTTGTPCTAE